MRKQLFIVIPFLILTLMACSDSHEEKSNDEMTLTVANGTPISLPDAGASWYLVNIPCAGDCDSKQFFAKKVEIQEGSLSFRKPSETKVDTIDLLKEFQDDDINWSVDWSVTSQSAFSISMSYPVIDVRVNDKLLISLRDLSMVTVDQLMVEQENAVGANIGLHEKKECKALVSGIQQNGKFRLLQVEETLSWLEVVTSYDGPKVKVVVKDIDTNGYFVTGFTNDVESVVSWITIVSDYKAHKSKSQFHMRRYSNKTGETIKELEFPLPEGTRHFFANVWVSRSNFTDWWKSNYPGKPIPTVMPKDAGVFANTGIANGTWGSDIMTGRFPNYIVTIQSNAFDGIGPVGNITGATLSFADR